MRKVRNAFDRFRVHPFFAGAASADASAGGNYVTWESEGDEERYVTTEAGDRVTYDESEAP